MNAAEIADSLENAEKALFGSNVYAVTDSNVADLYPSLFSGVRKTIIGAGEKYKTLSTVGGIISDMVEAGCDRQTTVVAVGGGVTGDVAGFAAACLNRA